MRSNTTRLCACVCRSALINGGVASVPGNPTASVAPTLDHRSLHALEGIGRYAATLFPFFVLLAASVRRQRAHEALLVSGALVLSLLSALFATWHPVY